MKQALTRVTHGSRGQRKEIPLDGSTESSDLLFLFFHRAPLQYSTEDRQYSVPQSDSSYFFSSTGRLRMMHGIVLWRIRFLLMESESSSFLDFDGGGMFSGRFFCEHAYGGKSCLKKLPRIRLESEK